MNCPKQIRYKPPGPGRYFSFRLKALRPGKEKGATIMLGGKAPIVTGALMSWVIVPFMKLEAPYDNLEDLIRKLWEWWDESGKNRERIGELVDRIGMRSMLESTGLPPVPQMVKAPRTKTSWREPVRADVSSRTAASRPWWRVSPPFVSVAPSPPAREAGTTWFS